MSALDIVNYGSIKANTIASLRIKNQYLIGILSVVTELGASNVSTALVVKTWKAKGRLCDEQFFMHFDVLCSYQFLKQNCCEKVRSFEQLLDFPTGQDSLVTITQEGQAFVERYGG